MDKFVPIWERDNIQGETLVFAEENGEISANLAFDAPKGLSLYTREGQRLVENKDYVLSGNRVLLSDKSVPYFKEGWLRNVGVPADLPTENERYHVDGCLLAEPKFLRNMQVLADYNHKATVLPRVLPDLLDLPLTYSLLREKKRIKIALMGDSISNAANSSWEMGFDGYEHWFSPVMSYLSDTYGAETEFINISRSGYGTEWALSVVDEKFADKTTDLAIIAFGMNDGTAGMSAEMFTENIACLTKKIRKHNPKTEFIIVATPVPNPESCFYKTQKDYIRELRRLEKRGVSVLNMTETFNFLLTKKRYCEISGNNINHPNDFGYAFYTDAFKAFFDTLVRKREDRLVWSARDFRAEGFEEVKFSDLPRNLYGGYLLQTINGYPSHTFCFYGVPQTENLCPAVVLVHGGGGNAFYKWVDSWVKRGYVAIAIDINGTCFTNDDLEHRQKNDRVRHFGAGSRDSIQENRKAVRDSWSYQTVAQIAGAHSFVRGLSVVNKDKTAIVGISWGGVASLLALGADKRFACGGIIYSAGFISEDLLGGEWNVFHDSKRKSFYDTWYDPSNYVAGLNKPTIWNAGLNDQAFSPFNRQRTCDLLKKRPQMAILPDLYHDNESNFTNETVFSFIDELFFGKKRRVHLDVVRRGGSLRFLVDGPIERAELLVTDGEGDDHKLIWKAIPVSMEKSTGTVKIPTFARYVMLNVYYGKLYTSSELFKV